MRIEGPHIPQGGDQSNKYQVQEGDTLQSIGDKLGISPNDLANANNLKVDSKLSIGSELLLPAVQVQESAGGLAQTPDSIERNPGENLGIRFHDQLPEKSKLAPGENLGIRFHDQMPQNAKPGEDLGIRFHDQLPGGGQADPGENLGIRFHDQIPGADKASANVDLGAESPLRKAGSPADALRTIANELSIELKPDMFEITDQGDLLITNQELAKALNSLKGQ